MSVKIYNKELNKWVVFPGTVGAPGKDAYLIAQENGYTGTKDEYYTVVTKLPNVVTAIDDINEVIENVDQYPLKGSANLISSDGVAQAIEQVNQDMLNKITESIVDNLNSTNTDKSLSANQGKVLKDMIANLANLRIEVVEQKPSTGETNVIYLVKNDNSESNIYDEYVFVNDQWELIGNTAVDLSEYYTKTDVDRIVNEKEIPWSQIIDKPEKYTPEVHTHSLNDINDFSIDAELNEESMNPVQNKVITSHLNNCYTKSEVDSKLESAEFLPIASENKLGGIKTAYIPTTNSEIPLIVSDDGRAYINLQIGDIENILGFTPISVTNIPQVLPNPEPLKIIYQTDIIEYNGQDERHLNLDPILSPFSKQLPILTNSYDAGNPGIYFTASAEPITVNIRVTKEQPNAIVVVPQKAIVNFNPSYIFKAANLDSLEGFVDGEGYKCFCITWVGQIQIEGSEKDIILVNGTIYD